MRVSIVLDLDDTLYLERDHAMSGIVAVGEWLERVHGITGFAALARPAWEAGERTRLYDRVLDRMGIAADPGLVAAMVAVHRAHAPAIALAADAEAFLGDPPGGCRLALVTDGYRATQEAKVAALGLSRFAIDPLLCTDRWGREYWKPHPRAFEAVAWCHAPYSDRFVYVADNPAKDFVAPGALGWATVQIDRPGAVHPRECPEGGCAADLHIESLAELTAERIERLCRDRGVAAA